MVKVKKGKAQVVQAMYIGLVANGWKVDMAIDGEVVELIYRAEDREKLIEDVLAKIDS